MSRYIMLSILAPLLMFIFPADSLGESLTAASLQPGWEVISETPLSLTLEWNSPGLETKAFLRDGTDYWELLMAGSGPSGKVGAPNLPAIRAFVRLPSQGEIHVTGDVRKSQTTVLAAHAIDRISPRPRPVAKLPGSSPEDGWVVDEASFAKPSYPAGSVEVSRFGRVRGVDVGLLELRPVSYDPVEGSLEIIGSATVTVTFSQAVEEPDPRLTDGTFSRHISGLVLNPPASRDPVDLPAGYLIITADAFHSSVQPLAEWKALKGFHVTVTKTSEIPGGSSATSIQNYIKDAFDNWDVPPVYVLLVGDTNTVPRWFGSGFQGPNTDLYYGCMDAASDYLPDLYVGRFSCTDASDVADLVSQTIDYEKAEWSQGASWAGKEYFMSSDDNSYHTMTENTHQYCMWKARSNGVICDSLWGYYDTGTEIDDAINEGRAMATYSGHGIWSMWQGPSFNRWDIDQLTNLDRYPIVLSFACDTGKYHANDDCFMERWIRVQSRGAIASYGASESSYWSEDDVLERRMWDGLFDDGYNWMGGFILEGKMRYAEWENSLYWERGYFEMYNLFGDPSLLIYTLQPMSLTATFPVSISAGSPEVVEVTVNREGSPCEGAMIGLYKDGEVQESAYTDAAGQASLQVEAATTGVLSVTVTAYNSIAFLDEITVTGGDTEAPAAPSWINLTPDGQLTWDPASDNIGVTGYRLYRAKEAYFSIDGRVPLANPSTPNWSVPGSVGNTAINYYFVVTALDAAENESDPSPTVGEHDYLLEQ